MPSSPDQNLSRRERQIMNVLFKHGEASVTDIAGELPDAPTDTAIRTHLRILENKGHVKRHREGRKHLYRPTMSRRRAARTALSSVLSTFFDGSLGDAVAAHLDGRAVVQAAPLARAVQHAVITDLAGAHVAAKGRARVGDRGLLARRQVEECAQRIRRRLDLSPVNAVPKHLEEPHRAQGLVDGTCDLGGGPSGVQCMLAKPSQPIAGPPFSPSS